MSMGSEFERIECDEANNLTQEYTTVVSEQMDEGIDMNSFEQPGTTSILRSAYLNADSPRYSAARPRVRKEPRMRRVLVS